MHGCGSASPDTSIFGWFRRRRRRRRGRWWCGVPWPTGGFLSCSNLARFRERESNFLVLRGTNRGWLLGLGRAGLEVILSILLVMVISGRWEASVCQPRRWRCVINRRCGSCLGYSPPLLHTQHLSMYVGPAAPRCRGGVAVRVAFLRHLGPCKHTVETNAGCGFAGANRGFCRAGRCPFYFGALGPKVLRWT